MNDNTIRDLLLLGLVGLLIWYLFRAHKLRVLAAGGSAAIPSSSFNTTGAGGTTVSPVTAALGDCGCGGSTYESLPETFSNPISPGSASFSGPSNDTFNGNAGYGGFSEEG